ncbi:MAG: glycosyltransferase [Clostridiales bacterium]|nr:glycosyltransferase [Clostridiales bacterium]
MNHVLSVAVACYNVENYLDKCLSSFSDDRLRGKVQVIVVNDGSKDGTLNIAEGYKNRYPDIFEIVDKENGGHGSAVNVAIEKARGKYFRIVDGDDWVNTENTVSLISYMESAESDMIIDCKREVDMLSGDSVFFPLPAGVTPDREYEFKTICGDRDVYANIMIHTASVKTSILQQNNIRVLEGVFYEDIEYVIKATARVKTAVFKNLEIYQYLVGNANQSVSLTNYVKRYSQHSLVTNELISFASDFECEKEIREYLINRVSLLINTNINISLLYNENRKEGRILAREFRENLKEKNSVLYNATEKRYRAALALNRLGISYNRLMKIKSILHRG